MVMSILAAPGSSVDPTAPWAALVLLGTMALLLGLFIFGVALLARSHRKRIVGGRRPTSDDHPDDPKDAWREAGRRLDV